MIRAYAHIRTRGNLLVCDVVDQSGWGLYSVDLMELTFEEGKLAGGRFEHFAGFGTLAFPVCLEFKYPYAIEDCVEWIGETVQDAWAVSLVPDHAGRYEAIFSFASEVDAVHFALRWR